MKFARSIAVLLIFLTIAPASWAMACASHCAMDSQSMSEAQASGAMACHQTDASRNQTSDNPNDCAMATVCHFAASAALSPAAHVPFSKIDAPFALSIASAPLSAETPPPYKPPV